MQSSKIEIHVTICDFTLPYYEYLVENYSKLADNQENLIFFAHTLNNSKLNAKTGITIHHKVNVGGSVGHGIVLNNIINYKHDTDIKIIVDADTVMLMRGWDTKLSTLLQEFDCVGVSYEDIGGLSSGNGNVQTYKKLPNAVWFAMSNRRDFTKLDFTPLKHQNIKIDSKEKSQIFNLPVSYELLRDVGWAIPQFLHDNKITHYTLQHSQTQLLNHMTKGYNENFCMKDQTVPYIAHQRGSRQFAFRQSKISSKFYNAVENYVSTI
jgi:hypothetical protein